MSQTFRGAYDKLTCSKKNGGFFRKRMSRLRLLQGVFENASPTPMYELLKFRKCCLFLVNNNNEHSFCLSFYCRCLPRPQRC